MADEDLLMSTGTDAAYDSSYDSSSELVDTSAVGEDNARGMTSAQRDTIAGIGGAAGGALTEFVRGQLTRKDTQAAQDQARALDRESRNHEYKVRQQQNALRERELKAVEKKLALNRNKQKFQLHYDRLINEFKKSYEAAEGFDAASANLMNTMKNQDARNIIMNMWSRRS